MTITEIQQKLYEKLKASEWGDKLKMFVLSKDFEQILMTLYKDSQEGKRFTPTLKDLFTAFENCHYSKLKVVVVNQDPYPVAGVADGMAFSCSNTEKPERALEYMFKELEDTVYPDGYKWDPNLDRWSRQGILLLNTSMTTQVGEVKGHKDLWKPFINYLFDMLGTYNTGLCYVFLGEDAKEWNKIIPSSNYKFFTSSPISGYYSSEKKWNSGNLFNQINIVMEKNYGEKIIW